MGPCSKDAGKQTWFMWSAGVSSEMSSQASQNMPSGTQSCMGGREERPARQTSCYRAEVKGLLSQRRDVTHAEPLSVSRNYLKKGRGSKVTTFSTSTELFRAEQIRAGCEELPGPSP